MLPTSFLCRPIQRTWPRSHDPPEWPDTQIHLISCSIQMWLRQNWLLPDTDHRGTRLQLGWYECEHLSTKTCTSKTHLNSKGGKTLFDNQWHNKVLSLKPSLNKTVMGPQIIPFFTIYTTPVYLQGSANCIIHKFLIVCCQDHLTYCLFKNNLLFITFLNKILKIYVKCRRD